MADWSHYEINEVIAAEFGLMQSDLKLDGSDNLDELNDNDFTLNDRMNLCAVLEDTLDIRIPSEAEDSWVTVKDVWDAVRRA